VSLLLRPLAISDLATVVELEVDYFPEPWSWRMYEEELTALPGRHYVAATVDGAFAGWAGCSVLAGECHVMTIATVEAYRRRGVGAALLDALLEAAVANGADRVILEVATTNASAQALYRSRRFAPVGVRRGYYARGGDAVVMCRELEVAS
jgi:ribosomal-protein-alanine N-acetyltransferase